MSWLLTLRCFCCETVKHEWQGEGMTHWVRPWTQQLFSVTEMWVPYLAVETWKAHLLFTWLEPLPISRLQCFGLELTELARLYLLWPTLQTWSLVIYCFCIGALLFWLMNSNISVIFTWGAVVIFCLSSATTGSVLCLWLSCNDRKWSWSGAGRKLDVWSRWSCLLPVWILSFVGWSVFVGVTWLTLKHYNARIDCQTHHINNPVIRNSHIITYSQLIFTHTKKSLYGTCYVVMPK